MNAFLNRWLPEIGSAHGATLDAMLAYVHWLMLVLFVGWGAFFLYSLWRFRASKNPKADYHGAKSHASTYLEVAVAVVEVVLIVGFAVPLWAQRVNQFPPEKDATIVRVVGEQFAWQIHYPGPDGKFGKADPKLTDAASNPLGLDKEDSAALDDIVSTNQMHLPVGKPVLVHLSSKDVIHSFGIPEMRIKQDAIPGMSIPLWFTPTVTTAEMRELRKNRGRNELSPAKAPWTYEIACAQLCGNGHYKMRGFVTIEKPEEYAAWLGNQPPAVSTDDF